MEDDRNPQPSEQVFFGRMTGFIISNFLRLSIADKLMLGFSSLLALLVIISVYALTNLNRISSINDSIQQTDIPVIVAAEKMIDLVLAEELYARRYMVFRTSDVLNIFQDKQKAFEHQLDIINSVPERKNFPVAETARLHRQYIDLLLEGTQSADESSAPMSTESEGKIKVHQEKFIAAIQAMAADAQQDQNDKTSATAAIGAVAFKVAAILCALGLVLSMAAATIITRNIAGAIKKLKFATEMIALGEFNHDPDISNKDELGDLAKAFVTMAGRLKHLEEMNLDTSPLTRLPGGTTIDTVMNKRITAKAQIAFCLMDIDNFKAYNDHYGYAKGNELIQATADIISQAVADHGLEFDFIGHIGGDDFVVITAPGTCMKICQAVIDTFDKTIPGMYDADDRKRGHIVGENRQGDKVVFPLATISIAVVTNEHSEYLNHIQIGDAAAEMKEHANAVAGSVVQVDKRKNRRGSRKERRLVNHKGRIPRVVQGRHRANK
jgi:GGDEF domain-containing protein/CHASE3 domain sensor protein